MGDLRKVVILMLALVMMISRPCRATDLTGEELLSLATLTKEKATPAFFTALLGDPTKTEENNKRTWWHYTKGNSTMVVCWNKKSETVEKISLISEQAVKNTFDTRISYRLKSGITDITQAIKLLGMPKDMTIKASTQEMHYAYESRVLRLFFRNHTLVDFCLY